MTEFQTELDNAWHMPDELWQQIHPLLLEDSPPKRTGRKRADWRRMINGIVYRVHTGCKWNKLPKQFGDDSTVHRWYQRWCKSGMIHKVWSLIVAHCPEFAELTPEWIAIPTTPVAQQTPAAHEAPIIAGTVGQPTATPAITQPAAHTVPDIAASGATHAPTVAIAPETVSHGHEQHIPAPAAETTETQETPRPQIAAETREDYHQPTDTPAHSSDSYTHDDSQRRAA